ncbi:helix-turn-helix domain-containing protein [Salinispora pacifica]|uniref:helix-turn-helix domain-containing protein n=1 Tax=Salinispora pacifica TaxID=351187 RepID=UPI0009B7CC2E
MAARSARHLTVDDVCVDLGITRSTFYDWRTKRKGPRARKLPNGEVRIERCDYEAWLESLYEEVA